ncbi:hypothetical protein AOQ88_00095 [Candidatus Riesia sp. GBBU]|nr:hypothetical protein AOQ88_00095 [Candidatus Riesia sp. GBBU]
MKKKKLNEIRQEFLEFFKLKNHKILHGSSIIMENDPTLLFVNSGMNQFKNIFLGTERIIYPKVATAQKCIRTGGKHNDLNKIGYSRRHHTFFEMLGNFSFGDYFKKEAIEFSWELLTSKEWFNISKERFLITVHKDDEESYKIWNKIVGVHEYQILRVGKEKDNFFESENFWRMGDFGPCGPCTEIFYVDRNKSFKDSKIFISHSKDCFEVWNIVFIQYNKEKNGEFRKLNKFFVDSGMGLERISSILQDVKSNYSIDIFKELISEFLKIFTLEKYNIKSLNVIIDHIRSIVFLINEGVNPGNLGREYILRKIIRRASYHGYLLGINSPFLYKLVDPVINIMRNILIISRNDSMHIQNVILKEESKFFKVLLKGIDILNEELSKIKNNELPGKIAFKLHDTYGFPYDLTNDFCKKKKIKINKLEFDSLLKRQKFLSEKQKNFSSYNFSYFTKKKNYTKYIEYESMDISQSVIVSIFYKNKIRNEIKKNDFGAIVLNKTVFYHESGGQVGDSGTIISKYAVFEVKNTKKSNELILHFGHVIKGSIKVGDLVDINVDIKRKLKISNNHSATHLLHYALNKSVNKRIMQMGSLINENYIQFDFSNYFPLTIEQIFHIENIVNSKIQCNYPIVTSVMKLNDAINKNIFIDPLKKYPNKVNVVNISDFSSELCIGTHANSTGEIGFFKIEKEFGISYGIRRIRATTGEKSVENVQKKIFILDKIRKKINCNYSEIESRVNKILIERNMLKKSVFYIEKNISLKTTRKLIERIKRFKNFSLLIYQLNDIHRRFLKSIVEKINSLEKSLIIVLLVRNNNELNLIFSVTEDLLHIISTDDLFDNIYEKQKWKRWGNRKIMQIYKKENNLKDNCCELLSLIQNSVEKFFLFND